MVEDYIKLDEARQIADDLSHKTPATWLVGRHGNHGFELHNNHNGDAQRVIIMYPVRTELRKLFSNNRLVKFWRANKPELWFYEDIQYLDSIVQRILAELLP